MNRIVGLLVVMTVAFGGSAVADPIIERARSVCLEYGFTLGTESFANCTMQTSREIRQLPVKRQQDSKRQRICDDFKKRLLSARELAMRRTSAQGIPFGEAYQKALHNQIAQLNAMGCL